MVEAGSSDGIEKEQKTASLAVLDARRGEKVYHTEQDLPE